MCIRDRGVDASELIDAIAQLPSEKMDSVNAQTFALLAYAAGQYSLCLLYTSRCV